MSSETSRLNGRFITSIKVKKSDSVIITNNNFSSQHELVAMSHDGLGEIQSAGSGVDRLTHRSSIDELLPAEDYCTVDIESAVKLRMKDIGPGSEPAITIPTLMEKTLQRFPNNAAMAVKREGKWLKWTYTEYYEQVRAAAKSFIQLGLDPCKSVAILGFNSPEWFISNLGCIFAGGITAGIYATNSPDACQFVAENSRANVVVVENDAQLSKILQVRQRLPLLKAIVQYTGEVRGSRPKDVYTWREFLTMGVSVSDEMLLARLSNLAPNNCCTLIYTSGTTGNPKGVMLSHDNDVVFLSFRASFCTTFLKKCGRDESLGTTTILKVWLGITWLAQTAGSHVTSSLCLKYGNIDGISYLPLSHVAALMIDVYMSMSSAGCTHFAQPDALKGSLVSTLREVQPHMLFGVPRVWEKIQQNMENVSQSAPALKRRIARWARRIGLKANYGFLKRERPPVCFGLANRLVFQKVRTLLGLDRCAMLLSAAAPITKETLDFFYSLNLPIFEAYGLSETTGPHCVGLPPRNRITSVGLEFPGVETLLANVDQDGNGELVIKGRHVFMGYLGEEEKTKDMIDEDGGLRSGDIGKKDEDGFIYITGRIKEMIISAGGENVAPIPIEDAVKRELPVVSNCMLIGDKKKFMSLLITLMVVVDPDTLEPSDILTPAALKWVRDVGSPATTVTEVIQTGDNVVIQQIQRGIDRVNSQAVSNAQRIQKWSVVPRDFSIHHGELGPTLKMRRPVIQNMYARTIAAFYDDNIPAV